MEAIDLAKEMDRSRFLFIDDGGYEAQQHNTIRHVIQRVGKNSPCDTRHAVFNRHWDRFIVITPKAVFSGCGIRGYEPSYTMQGQIILCPMNDDTMIFK